MRLDFQEDSLFSGFPIRILFLTSVLFRHLVDMIFRYASSDLFNDSTPNHHKLVRIPLFRDSKSDLRILLHVSVLDSTHGRVDENVMTVRINPGGSNLRGAIGVHGCEEDEVLTFQDLPCIIIQFRHI